MVNARKSWPSCWNLSTEKLSWIEPRGLNSQIQVGEHKAYHHWKSLPICIRETKGYCFYRHLFLSLLFLKWQLLAVLSMKMAGTHSLLIFLLTYRIIFTLWGFKKHQENPFAYGKKQKQETLYSHTITRGGGKALLCTPQKDLWIMNWQNSQQRNFSPCHWIKAFSYFHNLMFLSERLSQGKPNLIG